VACSLEAGVTRWRAGISERAHDCCSAEFETLSLEKIQELGARLAHNLRTPEHASQWRCLVGIHSFGCNSPPGDWESTGHAQEVGWGWILGISKVLRSSIQIRQDTDRPIASEHAQQPIFSTSVLNDVAPFYQLQCHAVFLTLETQANSARRPVFPYHLGLVKCGAVGIEGQHRLPLF